jgi:hypothetical protein
VQSRPGGLPGCVSAALRAFLTQRRHNFLIVVIQLADQELQRFLLLLSTIELNL